MLIHPDVLLTIYTSLVSSSGMSFSSNRQLIFKRSLRYLWLSSSDLPHGTGSGSPLHFKFRPADLPYDSRIVIVEGVLKADVLYTPRPELYIVATPCVTANHGALIELTHGRPVLMGFDQLCGRPHNWSYGDNNLTPTMRCKRL